MSLEFSEKNYVIKMDKTIQSFKKDLFSLRTGRKYRDKRIWAS